MKDDPRNEKVEKEESATFDQTEKLFSFFKPLSKLKDRFQKLLGSGLLTDLISAFSKKEEVNVDRNKYRQLLSLPHFVTEKEAIEILGIDYVLGMEKACTLFYKTKEKVSSRKVPYFKETLLSIAEKNKEGETEFLLIYVPDLTYEEIKGDLLGKYGSDFAEGFTKDAGQLANNRCTEVLDGYYLVDVKGRPKMNSIAPPPVFKTFKAPPAFLGVFWYILAKTHLVGRLPAAGRLPEVRWYEYTDKDSDGIKLKLSKSGRIEKADEDENLYSYENFRIVKRNEY